MRRIWLALFVSALAAGVPASAHHSFAAEYFENQTVSVEGEVVQFDYINPHAWVHFMAMDEAGELQRFSAEWSNPRRLKEQGVTPESIKPGERVVIRGSPGRKPADRRLHLKAIERPADGWTWPVARARR
jgi:hypothetical protein